MAQILILNYLYDSQYEKVTLLQWKKLLFYVLNYFFYLYNDTPVTTL